MDGIQVVEANDSGDDSVATDGGEDQRDSGGVLGFSVQSATENSIPVSVFEKYPGRLVFTAGAVSGGFVTIVVFMLVTRFL